MRYSTFFFSFLLTGSLFSLSSCEGDKEIETTAGVVDLDSLINVYPDSVELLVQRGNNLLANYEFLDALSDGAKAFRLDSNNIEARLLYANAQNNKLGRTAEDVAIAQRHFQYIVSKQPKNVEAIISLASTFGYQQDFDSAFKYVNEALRIDPKSRNAYVFKGSLYLLIGNVDLAKSSYETAVQQDPTFYEGYLRLGSIYQSENNPICIEYYTTANKLQPKNAETTYALAYAKQEFGQKDDAVELYREMAKIDTSDFYVSRGLFHLGYIKQFEQKDLDSAIYFYNSAVLSDIRYVEALHNLGMCYEEKGDVPSALKQYSKALKINPNFELSRVAAEKYRN